MFLVLLVSTKKKGCPMPGSNWRLRAHKTRALTTELIGPVFFSSREVEFLLL